MTIFATLKLAEFRIKKTFYETDISAFKKKESK